MEEVKPEYGEGSLLEVPGTICTLLDVETGLTELSAERFDSVDTDVENVVLLVIDAFGKQQWDEFNRGFFSRMEEKGKITSLTSVFPSATPVTLTTLQTGLQPVEHTLLGWEMYYDEIDSKLITLPFKTTDWRDLSEELGEEPDPEILFDGETVYSKLQESGVKAFSVLQKDISDTEYTNKAHEGSENVSYLNVADMCLRIRNLLHEESGKTYIYSYISEIDTIGHERGPGTEDETNQLEMISECLERNLVEKLDDSVAEDTVMIITADHGMVEGGREIDLMEYEKVRKCLETDASGEKITPCGTGRAVFLHLKGGRAGELQDFLQEELNAQILRTEEAVEKGLFGGGDPGEKFYDRAGELVIIPHEDEVVWFDTEEVEQVGYHGSLTSREMQVPFAAANLSELKR